MSDKEPLLIKLRGKDGEVEMTIPYTYITYYVEKEAEKRLMAAVSVAIEVYKSLKP